MTRQPQNPPSTILTKGARQSAGGGVSVAPSLATGTLAEPCLCTGCSASRFIAEADLEFHVPTNRNGVAA